MIPEDTDRAAHEAQMRAYRRMGPEARAALSARMSEEARQVALAGIRARHPEYDGEQLRRALFRLVLGEDIVRSLWPGDPVVAP